MYITNANGVRYGVLARIEAGRANRLLLVHLRDDGSVVQYVIAYDWDERYRQWSHGRYGSDRACMEQAFCEICHDFLDNVF